MRTLPTPTATPGQIKSMFNLRRLIFMQIGAVLIAVVVTTIMNRPFVSILVYSLIFTNTIGNTVMLLYVATSRLGLISSVRQFRHWPLWFAVVFISVSIGTVASLALIALAFTQDISAVMQESFFPMLKFNLVVAAVWSLLEISYEQMRETIRKKAAENEELKLLQEKTRLQVLQSKLNPHFLFNSLNSMLNLVHKEPEKVERMIISLSGMYRSMLQSFDRSTSTLAEETALIRQYLEIESIRMGKRLQYEIDLPAACRDIAIPALLLEPLVENAVLHGIAPKPEGGRIDLTVTPAAPGRLRIRVADGGMGLRHGPPVNGFGLISVRERLRLAYAGRARFAISARDGGGTLVELEIPDDLPHTAR
jgi:two-component system, LytTR family, sensor kinase